MATHRHPMRVVCRRTGLSAELLRVWERRYQVVKPTRTQTGRRLYSDAEIERLELLYRATLGGRTIGHVAGLPNPALEALVRQDVAAEGASRPPGTAVSSPASQAGNATARFVGEALQALERFDLDQVGMVLRRASVALPALEFLESVAGAVLVGVGTRWREGSLQSVHGHLAADAVRRVMESMLVVAPPDAPRFLVATLTGQRHALGAIMAAAAASSIGWSVTTVGADVPVDDIAEAAKGLGVHAVGLSLVHPAADGAISTELRRLRLLLPRPVAIVAGGASAPAYGAVLEEIGARVAADLRTLVTLLAEVARQRKAPRRGRPAAPVTTGPALPDRRRR